MVGCWEESKERIYVMERESEIKRIRFRGIIGRDYLDLVTVFCLKNLL